MLLIKMPIYYCKKCQFCPAPGHSCRCGKVRSPPINQAVCHQLGWTHENLGRGAIVFREEAVYGKGHPLAGRSIADPRRH